MKYRSHRANPAKRVKIAVDANGSEQKMSPLMITVMNGEEDDIKRPLKFKKTILTRRVTLIMAFTRKKDVHERNMTDIPV